MAFVRESNTNTGNSVFLRPEDNSREPEKTDTRARIRLDFKSPKKYNRQILVGVDSNTTSGFDLGYDAPLIENNVEDMYWMIGETEFMIQGVQDFNLDQVLPIGIKISEPGECTISVDELKNNHTGFKIYLKYLKTDEYFII